MNAKIKDVNGTYKTTVETPEQLRAAIAWIVANHQYLEINGVILDGFTAKYIQSVLDNIQPANQEKYLKLGLNRGLSKMADIAFKLLGGQ